jgi:oligosaccharide repeat unit polymerase
MAAVFGFIGGLLLARWASRREARSAETSWSQTLRKWGRSITGLPVIRVLGLGFCLSLVGWLASFGMNMVQIAVGGVALTNIAARWTQSPVLVFFALGQIFFVPALIVFAKGRYERVLAALLFLVSVVALALLGARHMPAKLIIATFLAAVYVIRPKYLWRVAVAFLVLFVVAVGVVGAVSKQGIYGAGASVKSAIGLTYSDSASTISNFDRIVKMTPAGGLYHGQLLVDSVLAAVPKSIFPGEKPDYANYQLGKYLSGRKGFLIDGQLIDRSVSLAPTMLGAVYADFGVWGVAVQMILIGLLLGYLQVRAWATRWLVPFLVTFAAYVIHGVNVAMHNPHALVATFFAAAVLVLDLSLGRKLIASPPPLEESS